MAETMYVYENHKITGPNGYSVNIVKFEHGKNITVEGSDNITLEKQGKKYIITHNFIDEGYLENNSVMKYRDNKFNIDKIGIKNLKNKNINFDIYHGNEHIAYVNTFKNSLNINIDDENYVIPVIIYISVLSRRLKTKFGKIHLTGKWLPIAGTMIYSLSGVFSMVGFELNSFLIFALCLSLAGFFPVALSLLNKGGLF